MTDQAQATETAVPAEAVATVETSPEASADQAPAVVATPEPTVEAEPSAAPTEAPATRPLTRREQWMADRLEEERRTQESNS